MEIVVKNKVKRNNQKLEWTKEVDNLILSIADGDTSVPEIRSRVLELTGDDRSTCAIRNRMVYLGAPIRLRGNGTTRITNDMKDFVYGKVYEGEPITNITEQFNEYFGVTYSYTRIWRIALEANAHRDRPMTASNFAEDWLRLQQKFSPDAAIRSKHWLWRWRRLDENRSAGGCVFSGQKGEVPKLMTKGQFADQWTAMQKLFGIQTTS